MPNHYIENDAVISGCGKYRYLLRRTWDGKKPRALYVMLNPSTADAYQDDATIRSCVRLAVGFGYGSMEVVNLFAWRATDPDELGAVADPVGPNNDASIERAIGRCDVAICAWGAHPVSSIRIADVTNAIRSQRPAVYCLGKTAIRANAPLSLKQLNGLIELIALRPEVRQHGLIWIKAFRFRIHLL